MVLIFTDSAAPVPRALSCSLQLLLGTLIKLTHHPELLVLPKLERIALSVASWPQLWAFQLAQSCLDPRILAACPEQASESSWFQLIRELRELKIDLAEWGLIETLVIGGKGEPSTHI